MQSCSVLNTKSNADRHNILECAAHAEVRTLVLTKTCRLEDGVFAMLADEAAHLKNLTFRSAKASQ